MNKSFFCSLPFAAMLLAASPVLVQNSVHAQEAPKTSSSMLSFLPFATDGKNFVEPQTAEDIERLVPQDTYALPWKTIATQDILCAKRVWRIIDARDGRNAAFSSDSVQTADNSLARLLIKGFFDGKIRAYHPAYEGSHMGAWSNPFTNDQMIAALANRKDANNYGVNSGVNPAFISKFMIREEWQYLDSERIWVVRIIGLTLVVEIPEPDGTITDQPMFSFYHPDIRNYLSQQAVYGSGKEVAEYNWDKLFESRNFSSRITKFNNHIYRW